jgi:hypothetical protein
MPIDPTRAREDEAWQNGYLTGRAAALAEIERLDVRLADVINLRDVESLRRSRTAGRSTADDTDGATSAAVVFGHTYLRREAGDGSDQPPLR